MARHADRGDPDSKSNEENHMKNTNSAKSSDIRHANSKKKKDRGRNGNDYISIY